MTFLKVKQLTLVVDENQNSKEYVRRVQVCYDDDNDDDDDDDDDDDM